jgi:zinc transporter 1/2/3
VAKASVAPSIPDTGSIEINTPQLKEKEIPPSGDIQGQHSHSNGRGTEHPLEKELLICGVNITPLILLLAIGFHSIFEGIALGLIKTESVFINLMIGIILHHIASSISLGVSLGHHKTKSLKAVFFIFFGLSIIYPLGITVGLLINNGPDLIASIVLSLAGGTFVYISCSEILVHEFSNSKHKYFKFLAFVLGSAVITVLWLLDAHDHGEEH